MTCYDKIGKKAYRCFVCGVENIFTEQLHNNDQANVELSAASYHMLGGDK